MLFNKNYKFVFSGNIIIFLLILILIQFYTKAQTSTSKDSIISILKTTGNNEGRVDLYLGLHKITDSVHYANKSLALAEKLNYKSGYTRSLLALARWNYFDGNEDIALNQLIKLIDIAEEIGDKHVLKSAYKYLGFIYRPHEPFRAKKYYEKSFMLCVETGDQLAGSYLLSAIGNIYEGIIDPSNENYKKALTYYLKSLKIRESLGSPSELASSLNETSRVYEHLKDYSEATALRVKGLEIAEKTNDIENIIYISTQIGNDYCDRLKQYDVGLDYLLKAFKLGKVHSKNYESLHHLAKDLAKCYTIKGDYKKANSYYNLSEIFNDSLRIKRQLVDFKLSSLKQEMESELEKKSRQLEEAKMAKEKSLLTRKNLYNKIYIAGVILLIFILFLLYRNFSIKRKSNEELKTAYVKIAHSESNFKQITETINDVFYLYNIVNKKYEYISPNCEAIFGLDQDYFYTGKSMKQIVHEEDVQDVWQANTLIDVGIPYNIEYRIYKDNEIKWISEKSFPIFDATGTLIKNSGICRDITMRKKNQEIIAKKRKDITNSIYYARKIQEAFLVPKQKVLEILNDVFVLSLAKDIVSGDFYFLKETKTSIYIGVADCTGHGVPAGFLSMIGINFLNEIITANENQNPAEVLEKLRSKVIYALHQDNPNSETKDGMDIALIKLNRNWKSLEYSGAFNPLYLVRENELKEFASDSLTIGIKMGDNTGSFTNHHVNLNKGDSIYLFSDGFTSQFGGPEDKKITKKQFRELLVSISRNPMMEQEKLLENYFNNWMRSQDQVDDVCVFGFKVS